MRRIASFIAFAVVAAAGTNMAIGASAGPADTRAERDRVRAEQVAAAAGVDALEATNAELEAALEVLDANVRGEESRLAEVQRAVDAAEAAAAAAHAAIKATSLRLGRLRSAMAAHAVEAYIQPEGSSLSSVLGSDDASQAARRRALIDMKSERDADLADQIRAVKGELQAQRRAATEAGERAKAKRTEVSARLGKVRSARAQQRAVAARVQRRIDAGLARVIALGREHKELSARYAAEQIALQARIVEAQRVERAAQAQRAREAEEAQKAQRAEAAQAAQVAARRTRSSYGTGGSETAPVASFSPEPTGASGGVGLCTVGGITVNCQISGQLGRLLSAASSAGVHLSGGGWRDPAQQIALRRSHCGSSYYAIYQMSPSACRPPTARPGQSMHEVGLAIDFANCSGRGTACYGWLARNAARFGFYNLPSEPWHWSVNGN